MEKHKMTFWEKYSQKQTQESSPNDFLPKTKKKSYSY